MASRIDALLQLLEKGPDSAMLRFSLGNEYFAAGEHAEAVLQFRAALDLDRGYSAAWKLLGKTLADTGDLSGATAAYEEGIAVATKKGDRQAAKEMGVFLKRLQRQSGGM